MSKLSRLDKFLLFVLKYKLPKMMRKLSDDELIQLHQQHSPICFTSEPCETTKKGMGVVVTFAVIEELKQRYPNNPLFSSYDFSYNVQLRKENMYGKPKKTRKRSK